MELEQVWRHGGHNGNPQGSPMCLQQAEAAAGSLRALSSHSTDCRGNNVSVGWLVLPLPVTDPAMLTAGPSPESLSLLCSCTPDTGLGDSLFPKLGVLEHQDLWLFPFHHPKPLGAGREGRSIYHLHNLLQGYLVVSWILLCQGPMAWKDRITAAGKPPDPHSSNRAARLRGFAQIKHSACVS